MKFEERTEKLREFDQLWEELSQARTKVDELQKRRQKLLEELTSANENSAMPVSASTTSQPAAVPNGRQPRHPVVRKFSVARKWRERWQAFFLANPSVGTYTVEQLTQLAPACTHWAAYHRAKVLAREKLGHLSPDKIFTPDLNAIRTKSGQSGQLTLEPISSKSGQSGESPVSC